MRNETVMAALRGGEADCSTGAPPAQAATRQALDFVAMEPLETARPRARGIYLLPNLFTTGGLFGGFYAIIAASQGDFERACIAIFIAAVLDGIDGRVAPMTNTQSEFGVQYD